MMRQAHASVVQIPAAAFFVRSGSLVVECWSSSPKDRGSIPGHCSFFAQDCTHTHNSIYTAFANAILSGVSITGSTILCKRIDPGSIPGHCAMVFVGSYMHV
jgi:hypothetical protein